MKNSNLPQGVWPVMLTPFKDDGAVDWYAYDELVEYYIEGGAAGLFTTCLSGEIPKLTKAECVALAERAVQIVNGRIPVVAGAICHENPKEMADYAGRIAQTGASTVVFAVNQFGEQGNNEDSLKQNLFDFLELVDSSMSFGLYECPYPYHRKMSPELVGGLSQLKQFSFMKDTTANIEILQQKLQRLAGSSVQVFNANAPTLEASLQIGASGYAGIGSNFFCELFVQICNGLPCDDRGNCIRELAVSIQRYAGEMEYPAVAKYFLKKRGLSLSETCRVDSVLTPMIKRDLDDLWEQWARVQTLLG